MRGGSSEKISGKYYNFHSLLYFVFLIGILVIGGFLRFYNLGDTSFWVDEVNTVYAADSLNKTGIMAHPSGIVYERYPVYTGMVALVFRLFGVSEGTSRIPSAFFGVLSILIVYFLAKRIFNNRVGLITAAIVSFSHFEIGWARVSKPYTLLQFVTLVIVFGFILGFENVTLANKTKSKTMRLPWLSGIRRGIWESGIFLPALLLTAILVLWAAFGIHMLVFFVAAGLFVYIVFMMVRAFVTKVESGRMLSKYTVLFLLGIIGGCVIWITFPEVKENIRYFLNYTPPWAIGPSSSQNRMALFEFLLSQYRFPLAAFFFIGSIQLVTRKNKLGWIPFWVFAVPLGLLSFVFTHRVPTYIYYVYPFFLMIAAYGLVNLAEGEIRIFQKRVSGNKKLLKGFVVLLFGLIFIVSPWLRIGLKIPFFGDGFTNLAVTFNEWREASKIVNDNRRSNDLVITSLPQVVLYYQVHSDFGLNFSNLRLAKENDFKNSDGKWADVYAGVECVLSRDHLEDIINAHPRGWLMITKYHLEHEVVIPADVRHFIETRFGKPIQTTRGSVLIFHWDHGSNRE